VEAGTPRAVLRGLLAALSADVLVLPWGACPPPNADVPPVFRTIALRVVGMGTSLEMGLVGTGGAVQVEEVEGEWVTGRGLHSTTFQLNHLST
jgi:hypothetical protein